MDRKSPKIIIWMACYNHEKYVKETVDSVIAQTYENWELYVANDGSTDRSGEILSSYKDPRIHFYDFKENTKLVGVSNFLLDLCSKIDAEYIACLDSDDIWDKDKLKKQINVLLKHPEYKACFTWDKIIFSTKNKGVYENNVLYSHKDNMSRYEWINYFFKYGNCLNSCSMLMDKKIFDELGQRNQNYFHLSDFRLWVKLIEKYSFYLIKEELTCYRRHDSNISEPTLEVIVRSCNEQYQILKETIVPMDKSTFRRAFYMDTPYVDCNTEEDLLAEKFIFLINTHSLEGEQTALDIYFTNCTNKLFISTLEHKYFFNTQSFLILSGKSGMQTRWNPACRTGKELYTPAIVFMNTIDRKNLNEDSIGLYRYTVLLDLLKFAHNYEDGIRHFEKIKQLILKVRMKRNLILSRKRVAFIIAQNSQLNLSEIIPFRQTNDIYYVAFVPSYEEDFQYDIYENYGQIDGIEFISLFNPNDHSLYFLYDLSIDVDCIYYVDCLDNKYECNSMVAGYSLAIEQNCILKENIYQSMKNNKELVLNIINDIHIYSIDE